MSKTIRVYYIGGQYTDFANSSDQDYANILGILNSNERSFVLNNQWINKDNIITVIQFEVKEAINEPEHDSKEIVIEDESYSRCPPRCC